MKREELETFMTLLYDNKINEIKEFLNTKQEILNDVTPMGTLIEIAASEGKKIEVDIKIIYDSNSKRPKKFLVEYKISNEPTVQMIFNN